MDAAGVHRYVCSLQAAFLAGRPPLQPGTGPEGEQQQEQEDEQDAEQVCVSVCVCSDGVSSSVVAARPCCVDACAFSLRKDTVATPA